MKYEASFDNDLEVSKNSKKVFVKVKSEKTTRKSKQILKLVGNLNDYSMFSDEDEEFAEFMYDGKRSKA